MGDDDNLPAVRDVERLQEAAEAVGEDHPPRLVPFEAYDIGDVDERENPRACDLGYVEGGGEVSVASNLGGTDRVMYDPDSGSDTKIECDADTFVDDVSDWA